MLVKKLSGPLPKDTWSSTGWGSYPYWRKKLNVWRNMDEPPCTPSLSQVAPWLAGRGMEVAWPPAWGAESKRWISNLSGCWDRVEAQD